MSGPADVAGGEQRNFRLLLAYDGTDFRGFAASTGVRTVMGELTEAVERVVGSPVELVGAGRTDAGVHGWGQVVSGLIPSASDLGRLQRSINALCAPDIVAREATWADRDFSARFSATSRSYRYDVWNDVVPNPLLARHVWHVSAPLDLDAMNASVAHLVGEHHFGSFCRRVKMAESALAAGRSEPSLVRHVITAGWTRVDDGPWLRFEISATAFCHQMVRSIVGTTVDVGAGRIPADAMAQILDARDRSAAGRVAPPTGLTLWHVGYGDQRWDAQPPATRTFS